MKDSTFFNFWIELEHGTQCSIAVYESYDKAHNDMHFCCHVNDIIIGTSSDTKGARKRAAGKTRGIINDRDDFASCHRTEFKVGNARLCQSE